MNSKRHFEIKETLSDEQKDFLISSIERSYSINSVEINDQILFVDFIEVVGDETFSKALATLLYISKSINKDILFENNKAIRITDNPMDFLLSSEIVQKISDGLFMFQGEFLKIFHWFNNFFKKIASKYNAVEQEYPTLWPIDLYRKINYFKEFPQQVILATSLKSDFKTRDDFSKKYSKDNNFDRVKMEESFEASKFGLEQAVCDTCYYALQGKKNFQNTVFTCYNKVFRNEYSKIDSLDRLVNFSVRDIMFVGTEKFVLEMRQKMIDEMISFLEEFDICSRIETANDPFFTNDSIVKNVYQNSSKLKYEIVARLDFSATYIAIGSINFHLDFFGKTFNIKLEDDTYAYSGCIGIGFERLIFALYSQFGPDTRKWPENLRHKLELKE